MEPSDESSNKNQGASFDSEQSSTSKRNQVLDSSSTSSSSSNGSAASASAAPTCLCGHRPTPASSSEQQHPSTANAVPPPAIISLTVAPTTGGQFELKVSKLESIDNLKKTISKRLKVPKERICLLWKDRHLRDGTLREHGVCDGSRLTLLPSVETGLLTQRPEQSVMQALESLNDGQVNDFLSGKAPLNLTMRLGDHMMLIQLQLSAVAPTSSASSSSSSSARRPAAVSHQPSASSSSSSRSSASSTTSAAAPGLSAMLNTPLRPAAASNATAPTGSAPTTSRSPSPSLLAAAAKAAASSLPLPSVKTEKTTATPTPSTSSSSAASTSSSTTTSGCGISGCLGCEACEMTRPVLDTRALAEASRNLTQTLKQLSSEVLTSRSTNQESSGRSRRRQGAIIESMHHHGKGVYSGTFSGTLNPALQDRQGRPKRDISTIIHILNDLLCATPQYRRVLSAHAAAAAAAAASASSTASGSVSSSTSSAKSGASSSSVPMDQDEAADLVTASATAAAAQMAAALHRSKTPEETRRLAEENQATRGKLEQLRAVMEERRARRRARREARAAPYSAAWSAKNGAAGAGSGLGNNALAGSGCGFQQHQSQQHASAPGGSLDCSDSSMDTSDGVAAELVRELNTEPVVA